MNASPKSPDPIDAELREVFADFPAILLVVVFGSVAAGIPRPESDLDVAVAAAKPLTVADKWAIIAALAARTGRPIDLVDLREVGVPLLGQIVRHGRRVLGSASAWGDWISRYLLDEADFMPYHRRLLAERRTAWIGT